MKDLFGLFGACYLLLATAPVSGLHLKDHCIYLNQGLLVFISHGHYHSLEKESSCGISIT
jgi:hypothetical protein